MSLEHKTLSLEIKSLGEDGTFEGLLSVYDVIDEYGDVVERGAYAKTLQESGGRVPLLWQHDQKFPIGTLELTDGADGIEAKGALVLHDDVPQAKTAYALLKAGVIKGLSIGYRAMRKKQEDKIRRLKEIKLFEGSLVTIPANRFALVSAVKALNGETKDFNSELEAIQLMDGCYQMMNALRSAIYRAIYSGKLSDDEKVSTVGEAIDQFRSAFLEFLPRYFGAISDMGMMSAESVIEKLSQEPDEFRDGLKKFCTEFLDLEQKHPGTSNDAASAALGDPNPQIDAPGDHPFDLKAFREKWDKKLQAVLTA